MCRPTIAPEGISLYDGLTETNRTMQSFTNEVSTYHRVTIIPLPTWRLLAQCTRMSTGYGNCWLKDKSRTRLRVSRSKKVNLSNRSLLSSLISNTYRASYQSSFLSYRKRLVSPTQKALRSLFNAT